MSVDCPEPGALVAQELRRIATQYRESPRLIHLIRTYLAQVEEALRATCAIPSFFDIDTATGDQLTLIGKRLGWPRCHCVCTVQPVYGIACEGVVSEYTLVGFCEEGIFVNCGPGGVSEICITDDEIYRGFLRARRYQFLALFDVESLNAALRAIWGDDAFVVDGGNGRVVMTPGRDLTDLERALLPLVPRVLPVAPGIRQRFHFTGFPILGIGEGWGDFCEPAFPDGAIITDEFGNAITVPDDSTGAGTGDEAALITGPLTQGAQVLCEVDVFPYSCP